MAGVVGVRAMFQRIGFTSAAANLLTDEQGIDSLNKVLNMDDGNIENLCKVLRRPGGQNAVFLLLGKEPVLRGKTTNDDDKRVARRIMSYV